MPLLEEDVNYWLRQFGVKLGDCPDFCAGKDGTVPLAGAQKPTEGDSSDEAYNPFPPGYGRELEEP